MMIHTLHTMFAYTTMISPWWSIYATFQTYLPAFRLLQHHKLYPIITINKICTSNVFFPLFPKTTRLYLLGSNIVIVSFFKIKRIAESVMKFKYFSTFSDKYYPTTLVYSLNKFLILCTTSNSQKNNSYIKSQVKFYVSYILNILECKMFRQDNIARAIAC